MIIMIMMMLFFSKLFSNTERRFMEKSAKKEGFRED